MDVFSIIGAGSTVSLVGLCWSMYTQNNKKNNNQIDVKLKDYVLREACHFAMKNLEDRIADIKEDTREIKEILRNGR